MPSNPPLRCELSKSHLFGAFVASLAVHAVVVLVAVFAWPAREPSHAPTWRPLMIELIPADAPVLSTEAAPAPTAPDVVATNAVVATRQLPERTTPAVTTPPSTVVAARVVNVAPMAAGPARPSAPLAAAPGARPPLPPRPAQPAPPSLDDGAAASDGGNPDELVRAWLAMHQHYPRAARRHRIEGTVTLAFALDARGHVVRAEVDGTSGSRVLDRAALDLLGRAEPFPVAATDASTELPFEIEVEYRLASTRDR